MCFCFCVCVCVLNRQMIEGVAWQKWQTMLKALTTEAVHAHTAQERARGRAKEKERGEEAVRKRVHNWRWSVSVVASECESLRGHPKTRW